jgi:hypothetical protein
MAGMKTAKFVVSKVLTLAFCFTVPRLFDASLPEQILLAVFLLGFAQARDKAVQDAYVTGQADAGNGSA